MLNKSHYGSLSRCSPLLTGLVLLLLTRPHPVPDASRSATTPSCWTSSVRAPSYWTWCKRVLATTWKQRERDSVASTSCPTTSCSKFSAKQRSAVRSSCHIVATVLSIYTRMQTQPCTNFCNDVLSQFRERRIPCECSHISGSALRVSRPLTLRTT